MPRKSIARLNVELRAQTVRDLAERDGWGCFYCERDLDISSSQRDHRYATIDHVKPRAQGGEDGLDNYVLACGPCNRTKADDWTFFVVTIRRLREQRNELRELSETQQRKLDHLETWQATHQKCETSRIIRDQVALIKALRAELDDLHQHHDAQDDTSL